MIQSLFDKYDLYNENLLLAQYDVSEIFEHKLTKGEIREDFIIENIKKQYNTLDVGKGIITDGIVQSGQIDIIVSKNSARKRYLSSESNIRIFEPKECFMIMEVKSNATGSDIAYFNNKVGTIVNLDPLNKPLCGMFCYRLDLKKETILKRFGFYHDRELDAYIKSENFIDKDCLYSNIDFIISLHKVQNREACYEDKQFLIYRDNHSGYQLIQQYPIIKNLFSLLSGFITVY